MTRPTALRVLHGVEVFRCDVHDADLTRIACARKWTLGQTIRPARRGALEQLVADSREAMAAVQCRGCPIGELHAAEAGTAVKGGRHRRMIGAHPTPDRVIDARSNRVVLPRERSTIVAPPAVVPVRRPATAPCAPHALATGNLAGRDDGRGRSATAHPPAVVGPRPVESRIPGSAGRAVIEQGGARKAPGRPRAGADTSEAF